MNSRSKQELAEDVLDVSSWYARPVILGYQLYSAILESVDFDSDIREYPFLLAGVERIVDGLLDSRDDGSL